MTDIDFTQVQQEVASLTPEQLREKVLAFRTKQKIQQKKQAAKGGQKAYQQKQLAYRKALKEAAISAGLWDEISEEADRRAEEALAAASIVADADTEPSDEE